MRATAFLLICLACAGCESFPALDERITPAARAAPYPELVPLEVLLAEAAPASPAPVIDPARTSALEARATQLRRYRFRALQ